MLQCITLGSASTEAGTEDLEDGIHLNVSARVSCIDTSKIFVLSQDKLEVSETI